MNLITPQIPLPFFTVIPTPSLWGAEGSHLARWRQSLDESTGSLRP